MPTKEQKQRHRDLMRRPPRVWEEMIRDLATDEATKKRVASIVWWDFGAGSLRKAQDGETWEDFLEKHIDLDGDDPSSRDEVVRCLKLLGYWNAEQRIKEGTLFPGGRDDGEGNNDSN